MLIAEAEFPANAECFFRVDHHFEPCELLKCSRIYDSRQQGSPVVIMACFHALPGWPLAMELSRDRHPHRHRHRAPSPKKDLRIGNGKREREREREDQKRVRTFVDYDSWPVLLVKRSRCRDTDSYLKIQG